MAVRLFAATTPWTIDDLKKHGALGMRHWEYFSFE
jgi:hypothetical protein